MSCITSLKWQFDQDYSNPVPQKLDHDRELPFCLVIILFIFLDFSYYNLNYPKRYLFAFVSAQLGYKFNRETNDKRNNFKKKMRGNKRKRKCKLLMNINWPNRLRNQISTFFFPLFHLDNF